MMKRLIIIFLIVICFPFSVSAETKDNFSEIYDSSGANEIESFLPEETKEYLIENGLDPDKENWTQQIDLKTAFLHIFSFLKSGFKNAIKAFGIIFAIVLTSAAFSAFREEEINESVNYAVVLAAATSIYLSAFSVISASVKVLTSLSKFLNGFLPCFLGIAAIYHPGTAGISSAILLSACEGVNLAASYIILPALSSYMAFSLCAGVSPTLNKTNIAETIRKFCFWIISLIDTVFIGVLTLQTTLSSAADTVALRGAKFILGSAVPVLGPVVSEALGTVTQSITMLKGSVGIYGAMAVIFILLPIIIELGVWRILLNLNSSVSSLLGIDQISQLLKSIDTVFSVLIGIILSIGMMFIISLSILISLRS